MSALLDVKGLRTVFHLQSGAWSAVDGVDLNIKQGEVLCLVGESGSGKSVTGFSIVQLIEPPGEIVEGQIFYNGRDLRTASEEQLRNLRGNKIAMVFQDPLSTLNPVLTIGEQMREAIFEHRKCSRDNANKEAIDALSRVGIPSPEIRLKQYPHEFSGGMRQRVAIAIALLNKPDLIIADEPTTALDVTIQGQILYEVQKLARETGTAILWITHDLAVVAELADQVAVMYAGQIVESGTVDDVLDQPLHPYTLGLLHSSTGMVKPGERLHQINGNAPRLDARPSGCPFRTRCDRAIEKCAITYPEKQTIKDRVLRCHNPATSEEVIS